MNTCDTCKWWDKDAIVTEPNGWHGSDETGMSECKNEKLFAGIDGITSRYDAPTDGCGFLTGPKFGCIHWEAK